MKEMYTKIRIDFLFEDFKEKPEEISTFIGLEPNIVRVKGEIIKNNPKARWKHNVWLISSRVNEKDCFIDHLKDIFKLIDSRYDEFLKISKTCNSFLNCVISMYEGDRPFINFEKEALKKLCDLNASIEFDIYNF